MIERCLYIATNNKGLAYIDSILFCCVAVNVVVAILDGIFFFS